MLAQQTVQKQTDLEHKRGGLMESVLPGKYSTMHLSSHASARQCLDKTNQQNGWRKVKLSSGNTRGKGGKEMHKKNNMKARNQTQSR